MIGLHKHMHFQEHQHKQIHSVFYDSQFTLQKHQQRPDVVSIHTHAHAHPILAPHYFILASCSEGGCMAVMLFMAREGPHPSSLVITGRTPS